MSISKIKCLSTNPHFYSLLMQSFLSGYNKPCEIRILFMSIPILLHADSRNKLMNATTRSRFDTLFQPIRISKEINISGKTRLSSFIDRFNYLKPYCKESLIILSSENKINFENYKIILLKRINYNDYEGKIREWVKSAYYLGIVFSKVNKEYLSFFLGVDIK